MLKALRSGGWLTWALWVLVILIGAVPILTYPLGRDQGEFATIAMTLLRGGTPYVDVWNPKPPAIFYTYAGVIRMFGPNAWAVRTIDLLTLPLMAAALYGIGQQLSSRALGLWAVLLFGTYYFTDTFWTLSQNDGVAAVPMALAVWGTLVITSRLPQEAALLIRYGLPALVGMLAALTLWFKYPYVFFIAAVVMGYLVMRRRWVWNEVIGFTLGGLLVGLGGMVWLATQGALSAWIESAQVTAGYTSQGYDWAVFRADMMNYGGYRLRQWNLLWGLAVIGLGWILAGQPTKTHNPLVTDRLRWTIIILGLVTATIAMLIQAKGYDYHWLPMLPALSLLGAFAVNQILNAIRSSERLPQWMFKIVAPLSIFGCLIALYGQVWGTAMPYLRNHQSQQTYYQQFVGGEFVASESTAMATYLREHTSPNDPLLVWGFRPELYYLSNTRPATRFIFQFPLVADWYPLEWQQQTVDQLWGVLPPVVVVVRGDFMPWVTGRDADSNMLLQEFTELNNWLIFNYEQDTEIGNFIVWRLKPERSQ
jgi:hypothetical protein